jgi:hypothetical protein
LKQKVSLKGDLFYFLRLQPVDRAKREKQKTTRYAGGRQKVKPQITPIARIVIVQATNIEER